MNITLRKRHVIAEKKKENSSQLHQVNLICIHILHQCLNKFDFGVGWETREKNCNDQHK